MRGETVAANYAATLLELADRNGAAEEYGAALATVADLIDSDPSFRTFLETPRITDVDRKRMARRVFGPYLPLHVVNFILVVIDRRRQRLIPSMHRAYQNLLDEKLGREHVEVTLAHRAGEGTRRMLVDRLSAFLGREVIPHIKVRPEIIGGLLIQTRDTVYDGSVRGRMKRMRRRMLGARLSGTGHSYGTVRTRE